MNNLIIHTCVSLSNVWQILLEALFQMFKLKGGFMKNKRGYRLTAKKENDNEDDIFIFPGMFGNPAPAKYYFF